MVIGPMSCPFLKGSLKQDLSYNLIIMQVWGMLSFLRRNGAVVMLCVLWIIWNW